MRWLLLLFCLASSDAFAQLREVKPEIIDLQLYKPAHSQIACRLEPGYRLGRLQGTIWTNGVQGLASKSCIAATATLTITNGVITATSGC